MPTGAHLVAFAVTAAILIAIPGPSVLFTVGRALSVGRRVALLSVAGNAAGAFVLSLAVAAGLGPVVQHSVPVYTTLKLAGAAYLVYLGVQAIRHRRAALSTVPGGGAPATARALRDGFVVGVTNPKTAVFFIAATPQFTDPDRGSVPLQIAALGLIFVVIALLSDSVWALAAGAARAWFARSPGRLTRVNAGGGGLMIGLGIHIAVSGRAD